MFEFSLVLGNKRYRAAASALVLSGLSVCAPSTLGATVVTEDDVHAEYDFDASFFVSKPEYLVSQIVTSDEASARAALARINAGESFEAVAKSASNDLASRKSGGDLGWALPGSYFPEIERALLALAPGQMTQQPVQTKLGWHILLVRQTRPMGLPTFEASHQRLLDSLNARYSRIDELAPLLAKEQANAIDHPADKAAAPVSGNEFLVSHILTKSKEDAEAAITRINKGERFADVARDVTIDTGSRASGGDLSWAKADMYVAPFADALKSMTKGELLPTPVHTAYGWHVILLRDIRGASSGASSGGTRSAAQKELESFFFTPPYGPVVVRRLIAAGVDPNAVQGDYSALGVNCLIGSTANLQTLLAAKADPNSSRSKYSALDGCILGRDPAHMIPLMINAGAALDKPDSAGFYPISVAAATNKPDVIRQVVLSGQPLDQRNVDGSTPLSVAAMSDKTDAVQALLNYGANPLEALGQKGKIPANGFDTALSAAYATQVKAGKDFESTKLLRRVSNERAALLPAHTVQVFIEQDGKRQALNGTPITLRRAPFSVIIDFHGGNDVMIFTSTDKDSVDTIRQHAADGNFGNDKFAQGDDKTTDQFLIVSDASSNFKFHHWVAISEKTHLELNPNAKGGLKAAHQIRTIRFEDASHASTAAADKEIPVEQMQGPLYFAFATGEPIGRPFFAIRQMTATEIRWR